MNVHISKERAGEGEEEDKREGLNIRTDLGCELCMGFVEKNICQWHDNHGKQNANLMPHSLENAVVTYFWS